MVENIGCIIQARLGSKRLQKKVLRLLDEKNTVLDYVLNQTQSSKLLKKIIIATTILDEDIEIVDFAKKHNVDYFQGSSDDVLDRYYKCAKKFSLSKIVRITSDCPLIDPQIIDDAITIFESNLYDYVGNTHPLTFPVGIAVEVFTFNALENAWQNAKLPSEREHVTPYLLNPIKKFRTFNIKNTKDLSFIRITLDRINDLKFIKFIISKIKKRPILMNDVLNFVTEYPESLKINSNISPIEGYLKSLEKDKEFLK
jgi:spore coat polysaccharide biosynthesis protein SpsF